jgi:hypothetical protein
LPTETCNTCDNQGMARLDVSNPIGQAIAQVLDVLSCACHPAPQFPLAELFSKDWLLRLRLDLHY